MPLRVLVVDDTVIFRRAVSEALAAIPNVEVVGTAPNGKVALARLEALQPDLLTLDVEMPEMSGIEVLQALEKAPRRPGVIMLSSLTRRGCELTVRALELGAFDFLTKPEGAGAGGSVAVLRERLGPMIRSFERRHAVRSLLSSTPAAPAPAVPAAAPPPAAPSTPAAAVSMRLPMAPRGRVVLIGVSTGGPAALAAMLPALPRDLGAPVLLVQHMPPLFTQPLAESLARRCALRVKEAEAGEIAAPNCVYIAPGGRHLKVEAGQNGDIVLRLTEDPPENGCRPAVDYLFRSAALQIPRRAVAVIMTGMGADGTAGLKLLKRSGCISIAQDEASSVVWGMPKEAIQAGLVDRVEPLDQIAPAIIRSLREGRS